MSALFGNSASWRLWLAAFLTVVIGVLILAVINQGQLLDIRDLRIKALELENAGLREKNSRLSAAAHAVSMAAQAHSLIGQAEAARRAKIEEITEAGPAAIPEGAVDAAVSQKAIDLLNHDLFAPLGHGLRPQGE